MTQSIRNDFIWVDSDEPHRIRRKEMLEKYPNIKELYGYDETSKYKAILSVFAQIVTCYLISKFEFGWLLLLAVAYAWGGTINHSLMLAIHELSHDLFFPQTWQNVWFGIFASLPIGVPISLGFKKYHLIHHLNQGFANIDPDLPTPLEGRLVRGIPAKLFFLFFQPLFYVLRPLLTMPTKLQKMEVVAYVFGISFDFLILHYFGGKALSYLFLSTLLGSGLHPLAAHFIAEHYVWSGKDETYSYYGPLNKLVYNVGYHNEHHDFPRIPGSRLPELHKIAPEYYKDIPTHSSWPMVLWNFLFDSNMTPFNRVLRNKRKN
eukprot:TRINITY_DN9848_c0_g1_i1.p1 TRINITY_DN9848_c0_g1~~TRINITY_DN9848_c0_g1_i1.p1  ORF type:complete len:319 (+),score=43.95 TRINITY_DN9848_c0_g1_i1:45-1001(+)